MTKAISANSGASPSGSYTYTLTFSNTSNVDASALTLADVIPVGMTYVAGSGRWSISGTTALTDAAGGDPSGIDYDYGVTQAAASPRPSRRLRLASRARLRFSSTSPATSPGAG